MLGRKLATPSCICDVKLPPPNLLISSMYDGTKLFTFSLKSADDLESNLICSKFLDKIIR